MLKTDSLYLVGYASDIAGPNPGGADGPIVMKKSSFLSAFKDAGINLIWQDMIQPSNLTNTSVLDQVTEECSQLAKNVEALCRQKQFFTVIGGDHSCAIGTWSAVSHAKKEEGPIGLIWVDAHMDSHTSETSQSGNIHGMPLACLLGYGDISLTQLLNKNPKLKPEHVCLIGVRSFESGEAELLNRLNVRIFYMDEIKQRGLSAVFLNARKIVSTGTVGYGISIDIDSIDPKDAPGTGVVESDGLAAIDLCQALSTFADDSRLLGAEIVEFDPHRDQNQMTEKLIANMLSALTLGKIIIKN